MSNKKNPKNLKSTNLDDFFGLNNVKNIKKTSDLIKKRPIKEKENESKNIQKRSETKNQPIETNNLSERSNNLEKKILKSEVKSSQKSKEKALTIKSILKENTPYLLLTTHYNPSTNKAILGFYDSENDKIRQVDDFTGHRPYFIVKYTPEAAIKFLETHPEYNKNKSLITQIEEIVIIDRLYLKEIKASKVYTQTPGDVPKIRRIFQSLDIETFESDIRYHLNYIFDRRLISGMHYEITNKGFKLNKDSFLKSQIPQTKSENEILDHFKSNKRYSEIIDDFLPLFIEDVPKLTFFAIDIEVSSPKNVFPKVGDSEYPISCIAINSSKNEDIILFNNGIKELNSTDLRHESLGQNVIIHSFGTEQELLVKLFQLLENIPILITYNGNQFDLPYILNRAKKFDLKSDCLSYDFKLNVARFETGLHIDLFDWFSNPAIKLYAYSGVYKDLKLDTVASTILNKQKYNYEGSIWDLSGKELIYYNWIDSKLTLELITNDNYSTFNIMMLLGRITHVPLDELVNTKVSSWLQYFFQFEHRRRNYLIPNKNTIREYKGMTATSQAISKDKKFQGAIVIDPQKGIYFDVTVLDFASLYPSIISSRNLSYETINCGHPECINNIIPGTRYYSCTLYIGIISQLIGFLKDIRVEWFKRLSKSKSDHPNAAFYKIVEKSLKVLINAAYGVLGAEFFSFYCLPVAESTTAVGRHLIEKTVKYCEDLNVDVLYGDTDSVFLKTPPKEVIDKIISFSHKELGIPLEIDKEYRFITFSDRKKNYFGVLKNNQLDIKGLLGKKSNVPKCIQDYFTQATNVLRDIQKPEDIDKAKDKLKSIISELFERIDKSRVIGKDKAGFSVEDLAFTVQMTKYTNQYEVKPQHVKAAEKYEQFIRSKGNIDFKLKHGQFISYLKGKNDVLSVEQVSNGFILDINSYKSQVESTFSQILESFEIDIANLQKKVNLMDFI